MKRVAIIKRETKETQIEIKFNLDGTGIFEGTSNIRFLDHMLEVFAKQSLFNISLTTKGDLQVDEHHTVEDIGIVLGVAFQKALVEKRGIARYGFFILPMDEALTTVIVDLSGRAYFCFECEFNREKVGDLPTELVYDFWDAFVQNAQINLQIKVENGRNEHHKIEGIFKCVARALRMACEIDTKRNNEIPSTKGVL